MTVRNRYNILLDYFIFSKKQRIGIFIAAVLILFSLMIRYSYESFIVSKNIPADTVFFADAAALIRQRTDSGSNYIADNDWLSNRSFQSGYEQQEKAKLFYFDPNTLSASGWKRLGLRDKTIQTIQNYLSKGGKFRKPEDINRIYGLHPEQAAKLLPYVNITIDKYSESCRIDFSNNISSKGAAAHKSIDINTADTSAWIALPGIGSKLALRIVNFREKLGGFYSVKQVGEVYGLADTVFQKITSSLLLTTRSLRQIDVNTADVNMLKSHPYITWKIANAIVLYRSQHGDFTSLGDLKKIMLIDDEFFNKVAPYLKIR